MNFLNIKKRKYPFIIAEISGNHNQNYKTAYKLIDEVSKTGADAIKFQTFKPEGMTLNIKKDEFLIKEKESLWKNSSLYDLYKKSSMPWSWQKKLFVFAKKKGLIAFSSPFHIEAVNFLKKINCPIYKVASLENTYFPLIEKIVRTGKPIIISTGASTFNEINEAVNFLKKKKCKNYALLKCTSAYPSKVSDLNLSTIAELKKKFKCIVGFSDHSKDMDAAVVAVAMGAKIIEKHVKLNNKKKTIDGEFSLTPKKLKIYITKVKKAIDVMGKKNKYLTTSEKFARTRKRSIYSARDIRSNKKIKKNDICIIRPGYGMKSKFFNKVLGKYAKKNIKKGTPIKLDLLK